MIVRDLNVTFSNYGLRPRTFLCDYVVFGLEVIGDTTEFLDHSLEEAEDLEVREKFQIKVKLDLSQAIFLAGFIKSTSKTLDIDGTRYEVVNDFRDAELGLFKNTTLAVHPLLRFKAKAIGIKNPAIYTGAMFIDSTARVS